jgi:hypothetical protein
MTTLGRRTFATACALLLPLLPVATPSAALAQVGPEGGVRRIGGLVVYLGVIPAAVARGHAPAHPEREMHGGVPSGRHAYHLVVAAFDAASGARIEPASVIATVQGLGHVERTQLPFEPMTIAGASSFGGYVSLPSSDTYQIMIEINRPGARPARAEFTYRHGT